MKKDLSKLDLVESLQNLSFCGQKQTRISSYPQIIVSVLGSRYKRMLLIFIYIYIYIYIFNIPNRGTLLLLQCFWNYLIKLVAGARFMSSKEFKVYIIW